MPGRLAQLSWRVLRWPPFDLLAGPADVYHFTNFLLPPLRRGKAVGITKSAKAQLVSLTRCRLA